MLKTKNNPCVWPNVYGSLLNDELSNIFDDVNIFVNKLTNSKYPPRNIKYFDNDDSIEYVIEMALAGFNKADIKVIRNGKYIEVTGNKDQLQNTQQSKVVIIENGISEKSFKQTFELNTGVDSVDAFNISSKFENGLLTIKINKQKKTVTQNSTEINID